MLDGPLVRSGGRSLPHTAPTSIADKARESPPIMPALLKRTLSPLVWAPPVKRASLVSPHPGLGWIYCSFVATPRTIATEWVPLLGAT